MRVDVKKCRSFDELHSLVEKTIGSFSGIGELTVYDTAHRLGAYLGLRPEYVYLHAGTLEGAKALGIKTNEKKIAISRLPAEFKRLSPEQIEDCLCVYKSVLAAMRKTKKS